MSHDSSLCPFLSLTKGVKHRGKELSKGVQSVSGVLRELLAILRSSCLNEIPHLPRGRGLDHVVP